MKQKILFFILLLSCFSLFGHVAYAADCGASTNPTSGNIYNYQDSRSNCPPTFTMIGNVIIAIVDLILAVSVVVFFFMLIINGFNFITSTGDPEKIGNARKGLLFSVIGFGLIFASFIILSVIKDVAGVTAGFSVGPNGNIQFNLTSSYTPTPVQ